MLHVDIMAFLVGLASTARAPKRKSKLMVRREGRESGRSDAIFLHNHGRGKSK